MIVQGDCFDPNSMPEVMENAYLQTVSNTTNSLFEDSMKLPMEDLPYTCNMPNEDLAVSTDRAEASMEIELHHQQANYDMNNCRNSYANTRDLAQDMVHDVNPVFLPFDQSNWEAAGVQEMQGVMLSNDENPQEEQLHQIEMLNGQPSFNFPSFSDNLYPPAPDLLNLLHLPRCPASASLISNSTLSFADPPQRLPNFHNSIGLVGDIPLVDNASAPAMLYDPLLPLSLPPQPPIFRDLFQSLPYGYNFPASRTGSLFGRMDEMEGSGGLYQDDDGRLLDNGVFEFTTDMPCIVKGREGKTKHFATEKQRREHLNDKYTALRCLIPSPTKTDRASVVSDAIDYIRELMRSINELKVLVERKRYNRGKLKRERPEEDASSGDLESLNSKPRIEPQDQRLNSSLRTSWLQRKSKDIEVDVRIIENEVTIKTAQRKKVNCLLAVSKILLDELQLDFQHIAGGNVGDFCSFLFNSKISEGSSVYAGVIADSLIDVVDKQYAAVPAAIGY